MKTKTNDVQISKREVKGNLVYNGVSTVISRIGAFIFTLIIARSFLPEEFGVYSLTLAIILVIITISDLGLGNTLARYLAESLGEDNKKKTRSRLFFLWRLRWLSSLGIALLLFVGAGIVASFFKKPELIFPLKLGAIYIFFNAIHAFLFSAFVSLQKFKYLAFAEAIFQASRIFLIFISFYFYKSIESVFVVLLLAFLLTIIFLIAVIGAKYPFLIRGKREPVERRRLLTFSGFITLGSFTIIFYENIDKLILGYFLRTEFIGYYAAIFTLISGVSGLLAFNTVLLPLFTQLNGERLRRVFRKAFKFMALLSFPVSFGIAFIAIPTLKILYGLDYVPQQYEFSLILTSVFLSLIALEASFTGIYRYLLNARELPKATAVVNFLTSILNVFLNIILISYLIGINPSYGLVGASGATLFSRMVGLISLVIISKKKLNISPEVNSVGKPLLASLVMLLYLFVFDHFVALNVRSGIIMIISAAIVYFLTIFLIKGVTIQEIKEILRKED